MTDRTAIIVIGRNEGARLEACLASLPKDTAGLVLCLASFDSFDFF